MATDNKLEAQQIINLKEDKIILNTTSLQKIISHDAFKEKQVCVVSITGAFRQGKSFLLNFFLRYLHLKYKLKKPINLTSWLDSKDGPITGFPWKAGSTRHTVGILMWPEIFLAQLPSGEEIAIILLDTQGSFDNESTVTNCAAIFAVSTLISSVQIYNLKENIKQYDIAHLECFSGYGQLAAADSDKCPFQNLLFLVRDWQWAQDNAYGTKGGQELLNQTFNKKNQPQELSAQIKNIKELFMKISCYLLPHPGFKVSTSSDFSGNLEDLDPIFKQQIEDFVPTILAPENLVPKTINGEKIKLGDLLYFIESYCLHFQSGQMPSLDSMFKATSKAQYSIALKEAEIIYEKEMELIKNNSANALEKQVFHEKDRQTKDKAFQYFRSKKMMGNEEIKEEYESLLEKRLQEKSSEYENINNMKYQKEQEIKREVELRKKQQLENEKRTREQQQIYEARLRQEQEQSRKEQLRLEQERQREEHLRKEQQRVYVQQLHQTEAARKQERKEAEERSKQQQLAHQQELLENERRIKEHQQKYEVKLKQEQELRKQEKEHSRQKYLRLEKERKREEDWRKEQQRIYEEQFQRAEEAREQERKDAEERSRKQQLIHQQEMQRLAREQEQIHEALREEKEERRQEQEQRRQEQLMQEQERQRQEVLEEEKQRFYNQQLQQEKEAREQERKKSEERFIQQQVRHQQEIEKISRNQEKVFEALNQEREERRQDQLKLEQERQRLEEWKIEQQRIYEESLKQEQLRIQKEEEERRRERKANNDQMLMLMAFNAMKDQNNQNNQNNQKKKKKIISFI